MTWVYPRACGETVSSSTILSPCRGLSPRLRGNPARSAIRYSMGGSIPAPAGKPGRNRLRHPEPEVYPRACGETVCRRDRRCPLHGLSPRLRGNPSGQSPSVQTGMVYPRACGETAARWVLGIVCAGLSPRLRGNRNSGGSSGQGERSIPAPAGKPSPTLRQPRLPWVYPRACGETTASLAALVAETGLSPRLRGNPLRHHSEYLPMRL